MQAWSEGRDVIFSIMQNEPGSTVGGCGHRSSTNGSASCLEINNGGSTYFQLTSTTWIDQRYNMVLQVYMQGWTGYSQSVNGYIPCIHAPPDFTACIHQWYTCHPTLPPASVNGNMSPRLYHLHPSMEMPIPPPSFTTCIYTCHPTLPPVPINGNVHPPPHFTTCIYMPPHFTTGIDTCHPTLPPAYIHATLLYHLHIYMPPHVTTCIYTCHPTLPSASINGYTPTLPPVPEYIIMAVGQLN